MATLICDISISLDGFVAGPNPSLEKPLGDGGELLHEWAFAAASWRESHGLEGGEANADSEVVEESLRNTGAVVMGRRMFSGGEGRWDDDRRDEGDRVSVRHPPALHSAGTNDVTQLGCCTIRM